MINLKSSGCNKVLKCFGHMKGIRPPTNLITLHEDNKGADHPLYLRSLRNVFCVRSLERALAELAAWKILIFMLVFVAE